jgi:uncharacterized protein (DUF305 family)
MRTRPDVESPRAADRPVAPDGRIDASAEETDPPSVSDATTQRLLKGVLIAIGAAIVVGLFGAAALWAANGDAEPEPPMNATDVGFLQDMLDHHDQALLISDIYLEHNPEGGAAPYAHEVIMYQTRDIGWMEDWLAEEGYQRGAPDRIAMEWMGEPLPVAEMTGMQTPERLQELADARGEDADRLFFEIMTDHHLGGVHMADAAAANGARPVIIDFAEAVSRNQRIEVDEYDKAMIRLGLT